MAHDDYNWIDDPWNEAKQAQDQEALRSSNSKGCLLGILAMLAIIVVILLIVVVYGGGWLLFAGAAAS